MLNKKTKKSSSTSANSLANINTKNLFLNVLIFVLGALILYMAYAIVVKLVHRGGPNIEQMQQAQSAPATIIQVEVLNGCGVGGVGDRFTDFLRNNKVDVVNVSNYSSFDIDRTLVIDRTGNMANAKKIASLLGIKDENVVQQINNDYFLDVSLVIGKDYNQLKPLK
ncbi:MAG: LytR C-terminal domain-containing protein [Bacteroidota bacterium]|nr:LytR C-terminal domain-containing protein [Bacteroidota bacterium]